MDGCAKLTHGINSAEARNLIIDAFEESGLLLGGLVAVHAVDNDFIWRFVKGLDAACTKACRRLAESDSAADAETGDVDSSMSFNPHPAIEDFLNKLRRA